MVDSLAPFTEFFQVAPSHMHNVAVAMTSVISPTMVNNLVLGANYFLQTFNDLDTSANPAAAGLNTGVTAATLAGSPTVRISGFATAGATQPLGRIDTTGHLTDTLSWTIGRHQLKIGGEYRRALLDIFYESNTRGTFTFDGTRGPWASSSAYSSQQKALLDFLAGYTTNSSGATIVRVAPGGPAITGSFLQRDYTQNAVDGFIHDTWQVTPALSLNFGVRYSYLGPLGDKKHRITTFVPGKGIVGPGSGLDTLYQRDMNNFAPRFGFAWTPMKGKPTVLRGGYGIFYDVPAAAFFAANNGGNGGAAGVNANPGGPLPVYSLSAPAGLVLQTGVDPWASATVPILGVLAVNQNLRTPYVQNMNFNLQQGLWKGAMVQAGWVASLGRKLIYTRNINAATPGTGSVQSRRPYNAQFPTLGAINQLEAAANSSFHSLQLQLTQKVVRGLTANVNYTWGHAIDTASEARNVVPSNSYNLGLDRGRADFDARHTLTAFLSYSVPTLNSHLKKLTSGWQLNMLATAHTGLPMLIRAGTDVNGDGDTTDHINVVGDPFANVPNSTSATSRIWFNKAAFAAAPAGTLGNLGRNVFSGPGFFTIDPSVFKEVRIGERVTAQFRVEVFNVLNWTNYANPTLTFNSGSFATITNTRNGGGAPGLGFGEPRNAQLALKLLW